MELAIAILGGVCAFLAIVVLVLLAMYCNAISKIGEASAEIAGANKRYGEASEGWGHAIRRNSEMQREYEKVLANWKELTGYADELRGIGQTGGEE